MRRTKTGTPVSGGRTVKMGACMREDRDGRKETKRCEREWEKRREREWDGYIERLRVRGLWLIVSSNTPVRDKSTRTTFSTCDTAVLFLSTRSK